MNNTFVYMADGKIPVTVSRENVEIVKLLMSDKVPKFEIIRQLRDSGCSLQEAVSTNYVAIEELLKS